MEYTNNGKVKKFERGFKSHGILDTTPKFLLKKCKFSFLFFSFEKEHKILSFVPNPQYQFCYFPVLIILIHVFTKVETL